MAQPQTLRELNFNCELPPLCIDYPAMDMSYKLKSGVIRMLPIFQGESHENPHEHLQGFFMKCATITGMPEEEVKLRTFPLTLEVRARDWFLRLPPKSINSWKKMEAVFLNKFFPEAKRADVRKKITTCQQLHDEKWYQYWERYNKIYVICPYHNLSESLLIQNFYDRLLYDDLMYIDSASGGSFTLKTPEEARKLLDTMAENIHQFSTTNEVDTTKESEILEIPKELSSLAKMFADFINTQSRVSTQIPSYLPQKHMNENILGCRINAIGETDRLLIKSQDKFHTNQLTNI
ncbi:Retrotransposon gag protein [Corchorus capsularis]|uniref:Retrotransposon gag protein n=1 Tax=Corchorus capsularis TaxID=210143 RepID=A0A1R3G942_COCAP|nr:Retrotransposon gag protein [Corchorus capsularis]